jgi:hypothetical protein
MMTMRPPQHGQRFVVCGSAAWGLSAALGLIALMASTGIIGGMSSSRARATFSAPNEQRLHVRPRAERSHRLGSAMFVGHGDEDWLNPRNLHRVPTLVIASQDDAARFCEQDVCGRIRTGHAMTTGANGTKTKAKLDFTRSSSVGIA